MAIIKKFRIKSFKNINTILEFENISLAYGNRLILDNINFKIKRELKRLKQSSIYKFKILFRKLKNLFRYKIHP